MANWTGPRYVNWLAEGKAHGSPRPDRTEVLHQLTVRPEIGCEGQRDYRGAGSLGQLGADTVELFPIEFGRPGGLRKDY